MVLGSILDKPLLGVRGRRPARTCSSSARRSSFQRAEAQVPVVAGQAGEGTNTSAEAWPGLSEFANPKDIQLGLFKLETGEKNPVWFFGEEMWD